jgi:hypothetical protein
MIRELITGASSGRAKRETYGMAKQYRIRIRGEQREAIDEDLMVQLVVMLGRQLAREAEEEAAREQEAGDAPPEPTDAPEAAA